MTPRDLVHDLVGQVRRPVFGRCGYCGTYCFGRVCRGHRDLPQLEAQATASLATPADNHLSKGA